MSRRKWWKRDKYRTPSVYCDVHQKQLYDKRGAQTAINARWNEDHQELRMYPCDVSDGFHLTKQMRRAKNPNW